MANVEIKDRCSELAKTFFFERQKFKHISKDEHSLAELYSTSKRDLESTFPNIEIFLRILLLMMASNCAGERSFSKL